MNPEFWMMIAVLPFVVATTVFAVWRWINARREHLQHEQWRRDWYVTGVYSGRGGALVPQGFAMGQEERLSDRMFGKTKEQAEEMVGNVTKDVVKATDVPDRNSALGSVPDSMPGKDRPIGS